MRRKKELAMKHEEKEIWKRIPGLDYIPYYASNLGRIKNQEGLILKQKPNPRTGYSQIHLMFGRHNQKTITVHKLIARTFLTSKPGQTEINHKNEIRTDNRVENLEYCTHKYNSNYGNHNNRVSEHARQGSKKAIPVIIEFPDGHEEQVHSLREAEEVTGWNRGAISYRLKNLGITINNRSTYKFRYASDKRIQNKAVKKVSKDYKPHQRTYQDILKEINNKFPNLKILSGIQDMHKLVKIQCQKCGYIFSKTIHGLRTQKFGCPRCASKHSAIIRSKSEQEAKQDIKKYLYDNLEIIKYTHAQGLSTFKCKRCGRVFKSKLSSLLANAKLHNYISNGCQSCSKSRSVTITNLKKYGHTTDEIRVALKKKHLDWTPYNP